MNGLPMVFVEEVWPHSLLVARKVADGWWTSFRVLQVSPFIKSYYFYFYYIFIFIHFDFSDSLEHSLGAVFLPPPKCGRHANLIKTRFFITNEVFKHKTYFYTNLFLLN